MLTPDQIESAWQSVKLSPWPLHSVELNRSVRHRFAREIEKAALKEAAQVCDEYVGDLWNLYKGRTPYTGRESGRADPHVQGESDGADKCAAAIRAIAASEPKKEE